MIPVYQDTGDNCFQACVASMFELPLSEVPHFVADAATQEEQGILPAFREWCSRRGVFPIDIPMQGLSLSSVLENVQHLVPDAHYILGGSTVTGTQHAVVCCSGKIVHDPEPIANIARYLEQLGLPPNPTAWQAVCQKVACGSRPSLAAARSPMARLQRDCPKLRGSQGQTLRRSKQGAASARNRPQGPPPVREVDLGGRGHQRASSSGNGSKLILPDCNPLPQRSRAREPSISLSVLAVR